MFNKTKRNSNIEMLRFFSMLMIVAGHFAGQGGLKAEAAGNQRVLLYVFGSGQRVAINIFLIISVWFLVDQQFKAVRLIRVWGEVFFYTVILTVGLKLGGFSVSIKQLIQAFLPFFGRPLWYASAYIALIMLAPFYKLAIERFTKQQFKALVIVLSLIICILPTISSEMDTYLCAIAWFAFVYFFIAFCKEYIMEINVNGPLCILAGVMLYVILSAFSGMCFESGIMQATQSMAERFLHDFKSLPNFVIALLIFYGVASMKENHLKPLNVFASCSFAVYIIHQTPAFYPVLWNSLKATGLYEGTKLIPSFIVTVLGLYLVVSCIDMLRRRFIEEPIMRSKLVCYLSNRIEKFYAVKEE